MSITLGKTHQNKPVGGEYFEMWFVEFGLVGDTTVELTTGMSQVLDVQITPVGNPDGGLFVDEVSALSVFNSGKSIVTPTAGITLTRGGTPTGGAKFFVKLTGVM